MKLLIHTCCAPCFTTPYFDIKKEGIDITAYFYNPNIHPYKEFERRLGALKEFSEKEKINVIYNEEYGLDFFVKEIYQNDKQGRCARCYEDRFTKTVEQAKKENADAFTSTMLLSPYQDHELMVDICKRLSEEYKIEFYYEDWRPLYKKSIELSKQYDLYRQPYCGCVFSEQERYLSKQ